MKTVLKSILVIAVIAGSWVGTYEFVFKKQLEQKAALSKKIHDQACIVDELKKLAQEATEARYQSVLSPAFEALTFKTPATSDVSELVAELTALSKKSKLGMVSYETSEHEKNVLLEVRLAGRPKQVFEFLQNLSTLERLVLVERFSYENRTAELFLRSPWGEIEIAGVKARHTPYACGDSSRVNLAPIEIPWKSVVSQKIPVITRSPFIEQLRHITARGLHLVGLVQQRSAWLGLVEDEHGFGQVVRVGDKLPNGFQVVGISRQGLSLVSGSIRQTMSWRKP